MKKILEKIETLLSSKYLPSLGNLAVNTFSQMFLHICYFLVIYGIFYILEVPWYIDILAITIALCFTFANFKVFLKNLFVENFEVNKKNILRKIYVKLSREYHATTDYIANTDEDYEKEEKEIRNLSITLHEIEKIFTEQEAENQKKLEELYLQDIQYYMSKENEK